MRKYVLRLDIKTDKKITNKQVDEIRDELLTILDFLDIKYDLNIYEGKLKGDKK